MTGARSPPRLVPDPPTTTASGVWRAYAASYDFHVLKVAGLFQTQQDTSVPMNNEFYEFSATVPLGKGTLL